MFGIQQIPVDPRYKYVNDKIDHTCNNYIYCHN